MSEVTKTAFRRYQIMAWLVGTFLAFLSLIALPLKYIAHTKIPGYGLAWQMHGFLYMGYLLATADLGVKARWHVGKMMVTAVLGTIPLMSFVAESRLRKEFV